MKKYTHILVFLSLTLLVLPFFGRGYFFLLDSPLVTDIHLNLQEFFSTNFFWFLVFFKGLCVFLPTWLVQRFLYLAAIFLLGYSGYRLLETQTKAGAYFSGMLLMFNPYVYAHVLDGQIGIVLSISMMVFFFHFLFQFFRTRENKPLVLAAIFAACAVMWTPHSIFFVLLSLLIFSLFDTIQSRRFLQTCRYISILVGIVLVLNSNWILGTIFGGGTMQDTLGQISPTHFAIFATASGDTNLYFNTLTLHGFWGESQGRYVSTYADNAYWQALFLVLFALVCVGVYARLRDTRNTNKHRDYTFLVLAFVSYILSLGISHANIFAPISQFLYDHIPLYIGLREPQKWAGILLITYAYFGGFGVEYIVRQPFIQRGYPKLIAGLLLFLPILSTPTMLFGASGQLFLSDYPVEWYTLRERFSATRSTHPDLNCAYLDTKQSTQCYGVLVFPWHQYMGMSFTHKVIANPAEGFFDTTKVLQGDNMEIGDIYTQSVRRESSIIERSIGPRGAFRDGVSGDDADAFMRDIKGLGIQDILLLKEADFLKYEAWMTDFEKMGRLKTLEDNARFHVFRVLP